MHLFTHPICFELFSSIDIADTLRYLLIGNPAEEESREVSNNEVGTSIHFLLKEYSRNPHKSTYFYKKLEAEM